METWKIALIGVGIIFVLLLVTFVILYFTVFSEKKCVPIGPAIDPPTTITNIEVAPDRNTITLSIDSDLVKNLTPASTVQGLIFDTSSKLLYESSKQTIVPSDKKIKVIVDVTPRPPALPNIPGSYFRAEMRFEKDCTGYYASRGAGYF